MHYFQHHQIKFFDFTDCILYQMNISAFTLIIMSFLNNVLFSCHFQYCTQPPECVYPIILNPVLRVLHPANVIWPILSSSSSRVLFITFIICLGMLNFLLPLATFLTDLTRTHWPTVKFTSRTPCLESKLDLLECIFSLPRQFFSSIHPTRIRFDMWYMSSHQSKRTLPHWIIGSHPKVPILFSQFPISIFPSVIG